MRAFGGGRKRNRGDRSGIGPPLWFMGLVRKAIFLTRRTATRWAFLVATLAHREITLRPGGLSVKAVGDEGEAIRLTESAGHCQEALEPR